MKRYFEKRRKLKEKINLLEEDIKRIEGEMALLNKNLECLDGQYLELDKKLVDLDVAFQINYESIIGSYGTKSKKKVKYLLKNDLVSFIGTDIHRKDQLNPKKFSKIKDKIIKIIGEEEFNNISYNNIKEIIDKV